MTSHDLEALEREIDNEYGHFTPVADSWEGGAREDGSEVEIPYTVIAPQQNPWEMPASTQRVKSVRIALTFSRRGLVKKAITRVMDGRVSS